MKILRAMYVTLQGRLGSLDQERATICSEVREPYRILWVLEEVTFQCAIDPEDISATYDQAN